MEFNTGPLVEGGEFICTTHNFTAKTKEEWDNHVTKTLHFAVGKTPCVYCGVRIAGKFDITPDGVTNAVCEVCANGRGVQSTGRRMI